MIRLAAKVGVRSLLANGLLVYALINGAHWSIVAVVWIVVIGQEIDAVIISNLITALFDRVTSRGL